MNVTIPNAPTPYLSPRGIGIRPPLKNSLKWGLASLLASSVIFVAAGNPNDAKGQKEGADDGDESVYSLEEGITPCLG
jgi:hypothetical protein